MTKLTLLTAAALIAVSATGASAYQATSLGDRIKSNWDVRNDDTLAERQAVYNQYNPSEKTSDKAAVKGKKHAHKKAAPVAKTVKPATK